MSSFRNAVLIPETPCPLAMAPGRPGLFPVFPVVGEDEGQDCPHEEDGVLDAGGHEEVRNDVHEDYHRRQFPAPGVYSIPLDPGGAEDDVGNQGHDQL